MTRGSLLRASVRELGQTVVMVTHDPVAAGYADRVLFLADGRVSGEMSAPTPQSVLDYLKRKNVDRYRAICQTLGIRK